MIYPMFAMVLLTFAVLIYMAALRFRCVKNKQVHPRYFKLMQGEALPDNVAKAGRHFSNLCETPPLFYAAGILAIVMNVTGDLVVHLGWAYVASRVVHAMIHLTYNNPLHRLGAFAVSLVCILGIWIALLSKVAA
ncbi:MAPEG family protein [Corallincola platygyrae]|uniref:MAPEG family protein n=1 Tax=Corallincola platygyrae TaxID=1193278 RepID=A0ABW4XJ75_9GAMM